MNTGLPQKIGRYEIVAELGRGAMGIVYRAVDPNIDRAVALKTMRLDVHGTDEEEILKRFKHEAKLAGVMNHPNIVTIYDAGEDQGVFYIAMEYLEGTTLQSVLYTQKSVPVERAIEISRHMCPALDYAHQRKVIHRDIKPANIMLSNNGMVKIMDFGIAKSGATMTTAGQVLGTPTYMSPEQVRGRQLDGRTDLFSYGVCLYEMITGEKPFSGQNVTTIIYKIMNEEPIPPRELDVSIHPGISAIISKALSKNADTRYQTGAELFHDLENYKSFGSTLDSTRVMPAAPSSPESATVTRLGQPASAPRPVSVPASSGVAAAAKAAHSADPAMAESTVRMTAKQAPPAAKLDRNKLMMIGGAVLALLLVTGGVIKAARRKPQPPAATAGSTSQAASVPPPPATVSDSSAKPPEVSAPATDSAAQPAATTPKPLRTHKLPAPVTQAAAPPVAAKPAPVPETSDLHISSTPAGAKVTISGATQANWTTPFTADKMPPGTYEVSFNKPGYHPLTRSIKVESGKPASLSADLVAMVAHINVNSSPAGADIYLDGKKLDQVTPSVLSVEKGEHQIEVRKDGFQESAMEMSLDEGQNFNFAPILQVDRPNQKRGGWGALRRIFGGGAKQIPAGKGMLSVRTSPPGAQLFHNGKAADLKTPFSVPIDPGTYKVTIRLEGYRPVHQEFVVTEGKATNVEVTLEPKGR